MPKDANMSQDRTASSAHYGFSKLLSAENIQPLEQDLCCPLPILLF